MSRGTFWQPMKHDCSITINNKRICLPLGSAAGNLIVGTAVDDKISLFDRPQLNCWRFTKHSGRKWCPHITLQLVAGPQHCRIDFTKLSHLRRCAGCLRNRCMLVTALLLVHPATTQYFPGMARINPTPTSHQIPKHGTVLPNDCPVGHAPTQWQLLTSRHPEAQNEAGRSRR